MRLFRLEHTYCPRPKPDGIHAHGACVNTADCYQGHFGYRGEPPYECLPNERCAVTKSQIPDWSSPLTSEDDAVVLGLRGWRFIEYDVDSFDARYDHGQYLVDLDRAKKIAEHQPVQILFPDEPQQLELFAA